MTGGGSAPVVDAGGVGGNQPVVDGQNRIVYRVKITGVVDRVRDR